MSEYSDGAVALPGHNTTDLVASEFAESYALFTVSSQRTFITPHPKQVLMGFRELLNRCWENDRGDDEHRILIWVLDLGRQEFEDSTRFWNVQEVRSRFKALKSFKEGNAKIRWLWLQSRVVIVLHDPNADAYDVAEPPTFTSRDALFEEIPGSWRQVPQIHTLYGSDFNRFKDATFTIFLRRPVNRQWKYRAPNEDGRHEFRYFGHAPFTAPGDPGKREARGLELPAPGAIYEDGFRTIYVAATEFLRRSGVASGEGRRAVSQLRHLGFRVMRLEEFLEDL
jgi:hypothetical protein